MPNQKLSRRMTTLDATFLYFERKEAPMHIGSVQIFEGEVPFDDFVRMMEAKMHLIPRYQQIVKFDPFYLGHPTYEFDPHFDVRNHVFRLQIEPPGGEKELIELVSRIFTPVMDRSKPLWDIYWVYGLEGGNCAMIPRIHHCMVDGISGIDLIKIILDISPEVKIPPKPETAIPAREPRLDPMRQFFDSLLGGMQEGMQRWMEFQNGLINLSQALAKPPSREAMMKVGGELPSLLQPATVLPFNGQCSGERKLVWKEFSFAEVRAARSILGGTVNDVALTVLSGAVSKYVAHHGQELANRKARFMVPVSLRQENQHGALGNLVSLLPVEIPLDLTDPGARFRFVNQETARLKSGRMAEGINLISAMIGMLPAPVQALTGALALMPFPVMNMVATNVPGPQVPLYTMGKKMIAYYPYVPVGYAVGCGCSILTYDQKITFGLTADVQAMPDVEVLRDFLRDSYAELMAAAGVETIEPLPIKSKRRVKKAAPKTAKAIKTAAQTSREDAKKAANKQPKQRKAGAKTAE